MILSITESNSFQALGAFLQSVLPAGTAVIRGQQNRAAEPSGTDFAVMWPLTRERIAMNIDVYSDVAFNGSIAGTTLTVSLMLQGTIVNGSVIDANGIVANTTIVNQLSGTTGGAGTYKISQAQTLASTTMQTGVRSVMQPVQVTHQVDVHGPNSADNAQIISTLVRDEYGVNFFAGESIGALGIQPLYSSEPRQMPFMNGEQQAEEKWVVEVTMQLNPVVSITQDYASKVSVGLIKNVETYPV